MIHASRILRHSRKLIHTHNAIRKERAGLARWFTRRARKQFDGIDDVRRSSQLGIGPGEKHGDSMFPMGASSSPSPQSINQRMISTVRMDKGSILWTPTKGHFQNTSVLYKSQLKNLIRHFSNSGLPPHQEIGMPSLSPTMTEGNIVRWVKKEGDKLSPGEVLCEIETDKATVEMECMEEGYLAKVVRGDGSNGIKVGEIIAITVEEEAAMANFKDYTPSPSDAAASTPTPPKEAPAVEASSLEPNKKADKSSLPPHQEIGMPSLSPTMTEGNLVRWLKKEGEKLSPGEVLCEVETDKATVEMESMEEGYLAKIVCKDGSNGIKVGEIIAVTVEEEGDIAKFKDYSPSKEESAAKNNEPSPPSSPERKASEPTKPSSARDEASTDTVSAGLDYVDIPQTQIRKVTASRLLQSKQTIPHYYLTVDTCVDKLMALRGDFNSSQEASGGNKISVNDLVIKASALAVREVPQCNSSWSDDHIRQYHNVNINVAVQTDNGLCVPVIKNADKKGLSAISQEVKQLAKKAKENALKPEDYEGGTFTVSNLGGPFGISQFRAIINPPQSGILAVGSAVRRVVPGSGPNGCELASFMPVTLSCDHRVIDGAVGAEWLKAFKGYIENPESMLL